MNRRDFFKIVATTGATAAAAGCQQATEKILPLVVPNEQLVPGRRLVVRHRLPRVPGRLRRARPQSRGPRGEARGQPRPSRSTSGALCVRGQAALQGLYHPDRFAGPQRREGDALASASAGTTRSSSSPRSSGPRAEPARAAAIAIVTQLENGSLGRCCSTAWSAGARRAGRDVTLEPFGLRGDPRGQPADVFGRDAIPYHAFEDAEVVLSFGADFLETWLSNVGHARGFAQMHGFRDGRAGTFIHVEPRQSLDGVQRRRVGPQRAGHGRRSSRWPSSSCWSTGAWSPTSGSARRWPASSAKKVAEDSGVPAGRAQADGQGLRRSAKPGLAVGGGVAVTGSQRHPDAGRDQPAERRRRQRRQDRPLRPRLGLRQGHAVRGRREARAGDGGRRDRGPPARHRREPRVHAARRTQVRRRACARCRSW